MSKIPFEFTHKQGLRSWEPLGW